MMRSNTAFTSTKLVPAFARGGTVACLALGMICAAPPTAAASNAECTEVSTGALVVDVSYNGNFYSQDAGIWVGSMDPWEIASGLAVSTGSVDVLFNFYSGGTLVVDQAIYDYNAGDSLLVSFTLGELTYVGANADQQRALLPMPALPQEPEPKGPLPNNEVVISPKVSCATP